MMQRKNKRSSQNGYGSGYESNDNNNNNNSNNNNINPTTTSSSSPSKPPAPPRSGGISIGALTGHKDRHLLGGGSGLSGSGRSSNASNGNNGKKPPQRSTAAAAKSKTASSSSAASMTMSMTMATVKRNKFGTQPFDEHWLNLDCCGLICAALTYCLHIYGVYAFGWILLPPWFSRMSEDGFRELSFGCHVHRALFIAIASLAVFAHFKAMTTDPGAVPPDANPLPEAEHFPITEAGSGSGSGTGDNSNSSFRNATTAAAAGLLGNTTNLDELDNLIKGENNNNHATSGGGGGGRGSPSRVGQHSSSLMQESREESIGLLDDSNNNNAAAVNGAVATAGALGAAVVGGAAAAAIMTVAAAAPRKPVGMGSRGPPSQQQSRGKRMCRRCHAFKPQRAHHCSICKRCIVKMDHHCPWVNNCVGIGNHKYFLLFIFYTSLSCGYSFMFLLYRFFHCIGGVHHHAHSSHIQHGPRCVDHPTDLLPLVGLTVESLLFGLFTLCMMVDQWDVVMTNLTHIDRLKGVEVAHHNNQYNVAQQHAQHQQQRHDGAYGRLPQHMTPHFNPQLAQNLIAKARAGINEVFGTGRMTTLLPSSSGSRFHYTWLSPFHKLCFPENVTDDIFGYCRPCGNNSSSSAGLVERGGGRINSMEMVGRGESSGRAIGAAEIV